MLTRPASLVIRLGLLALAGAFLGLVGAGALSLHFAAQSTSLQITSADERHAMLGRALRLNPGNGLAWLTLAQGEAAAGNLPEAQGASEQAIVTYGRYAPHQLRARILSARALEDAGVRFEALEQLDRLLAIYPDDPVSLTTAARIAMLNRDVARARGYLEQADRIEIAQSDPRAQSRDLLLVRAEVAEAEERFSDERSILDVALLLNSDDPEFVRMYADLAMRGHADVERAHDLLLARWQDKQDLDLADPLLALSLMRGDLTLAQQLLMAMIQQRMSETPMPRRQGLTETDAAEALDRRIGQSAEEYFAAARERGDLQAVLRLLWWPPGRTGGGEALEALRDRILRSGTESMVSLILVSGEAGHHVQVLDLMREQSARAAQPPVWIEDLMGQVERRLAEMDPVSTSPDVAIRFAHHLLTRRLGGVEDAQWSDDEILVLLRGCVQVALGDAPAARSDILSFVSRFAQEIRAQGQSDPALRALYDQVLAEGARVALASRDHYAMTQMETLLRMRVESQEPVSPELSALYEAVDRGGTP